MSGVRSRHPKPNTLRLEVVHPRACTLGTAGLVEEGSSGCEVHVLLRILFGVYMYSEPCVPPSPVPGLLRDRQSELVALLSKAGPAAAGMPVVCPPPSSFPVNISITTITTTTTGCRCTCVHLIVMRV